MEQGRYVVVEGVLGVGKTSLTSLLAKELNARLILEKVEDNPFLSKFYQAMNSYAFQTQIFFLLSRYRQQQELLQQDLFNRNMVADYLFAKDRIFANVCLEESELMLYERLHGLLKDKILKPDLVIYLQASTEVIVRRIQKRGTPYEKDMSQEYIKTLNEAYNYFFFHYNESPLLVVNTSEMDFVNRKEDLEDMVKHIKDMKKGTVYYTPKHMNGKDSK